MVRMDGAAAGKRETKRRETLRRISETGLRLFVENGYEATTLEAIASASGISRRTFFYYFKSKEEVLLAHQGSGFALNLREAMLKQSTAQAPIRAIHACLRNLAFRYETKESIIADRIFRSTEALRLHKEAQIMRMEEDLTSTLIELWPAPDMRRGLQRDAMLGMCALRLALRSWRELGPNRSLAIHIDESFELLNTRLENT